jgi:hypothetical protein
VSDETTTVAFMLRSALPIDDVDQVEMLPGQKIIVVWVDVQDRPDLTDLAARHGEGEGSYLMTWFAASPGERRMVIGVRVEMQAATKVVFHLAFKVERYVTELEALAQSGQLWVVPGPPPAYLTGTRVMNMQQMIAVCGKGVQLEIEESIRTMLRDQLVVWKQNRG